MFLSLLVLAAADAGEYRVVEGDSCVSVARKTSVSVAVLHQLNPGLGKPPHRLVPGSSLRVAAVAPSADAHLTFLRPDVDRRPASQPTWTPAALNEALFKMDEVSTRRGAGAELTFLDESRLQLKENALIVVLGTRRAPAESQRKSGGLQLVQGELSVFLAQFQSAPIEISTPSAQVQAGTKEASVSVDAAKMTRLSVHEGNATVVAQGATVKVRQGEGTRIEKGKAPEKPRPLPLAPVISEQSTRGVFATAERTTARLSWLAVPRAKTYRVEVGHEARFVDLASTTVVTATGVELSLPPGAYFVRVTAIDELGLVSRPSAARPLNVVALRETVVAPGTALAALGGEGLTMDPPQVWAPGTATIVLREGEKELDRRSIEVAAPRATLTSRSEGDDTWLDVAGIAPGAPLEFEANGRRQPFTSPQKVPTSSLEHGGQLVLAGVPVATLAPVTPARAAPTPVPPVVAVVERPTAVARCVRRSVLPSTEPGALGWPSVDETVCPSAQVLGGVESSNDGPAGHVWLGAGLPLWKGLEVRANGRLHPQGLGLEAEGAGSLDGAWKLTGPLSLGGSVGVGASSTALLGRGVISLGVDLGPVLLRTGQGASWRSDLGVGYTGALEASLFPRGVFSWSAQGQVSWRPTLLLVDAATGPSVRLGPVDLALVATVKTRSATNPVWGVALSITAAASGFAP